jgi:hypothetical protein
MEIVGKHKIKETQTPIIEHVIEYASGIGTFAIPYQEIYKD